MALLDTYLDNVLRERRDTVARTITFYNAAGAQTSSRAETAAEIAADDARIARDLASANSKTIETTLAADLALMQATINATNATINANPATYIKDNSRVLRRLIRRTLNDYTGTT